MKVFKINDIPEFSNKNRIVVIGVIGKSPYRHPNKTAPLISSVDCEDTGIKCHWDERRSILILHAVTYLDTNRLATLAANLDENSKTTDKDADASHWLVAAGELAADSCRIMGLLFHLCHIVVLSSPTPVFDMGYLQLFKAIDGFRNELQPRVTVALAVVGLTGVWEFHGRTCCPRLLFHFRKAPTPLRKAPAALKRLEHSVEDQIYFILRKARIITNICAKALFAIPKNEEFVYISAEEDSYARDVSTLVRGLVQMCTSAPPEPQPERGSFRQFLQGHIDLAFADGFDDNVGKYAMSTSFFELPSAAAWRKAAQALAPLYLEEAAVGAGEEARGGGGALFNALATDVRFSQARCAKVLPLAQASYAEGLPAHYSSQHHAHKVSVALGVLESMARGPLAARARARLRDACGATWRARSLCEALSLTHHACIEPEHDSSKEHSSGVRLSGACACGRSKCVREDPYSVERANHTHYQRVADDCALCRTLHHHVFPVFQPSTPTYKAASVRGASSQDAEGSEARWGGASPGDEPEPEPEGAWSAPDALSPGSEGEGSSSPTESYDMLPVRGGTPSEKTISRQASTTEYLPGMLHTGSPAGLLPAFPSWGLVCLGASSLYSHSIGLPEHLQPGFLPHTNYLVPWDCAVRCEQAGAWRGGVGGSRGRGKSGPHHLTVKIFIGFEYECPRGHRFMMSSPESVTHGGSGGPGAGARLAGATMPLYAACACRGGAGPAQLARVHVVTPKAPVHVTLDPKVQPVPGGPIFIPQPVGSPPIKLSASAYWILRLPFVYCSEKGVIPRPRPPYPPQQPGALLPPLFGLED